MFSYENVATPRSASSFSTFAVDKAQRSQRPVENAAARDPSSRGSSSNARTSLGYALQTSSSKGGLCFGCQVTKRFLHVLHLNKMRLPYTR